MAALVTPSAGAMLRHGLGIAKIDERIQQRRMLSTNIRVFKSHFGAHPLHCARVWRDLLTCQGTAPDAHVDPAVADLDGFFMALHFLRTYSNEDVRATFFQKNKETVRNKSWFYVWKVAALKVIKITWPEDNEWTTEFIISVDGAHFMCNEPRDEDLRRNPKNFSHKSHSAGVNYEIGIALYSSRVVWINGPQRAARNDSGIFQEALKAKIPPGKRVIVDNGYGGAPEILSSYNQFDDDDMKTFKKRAKSRHETLNGDMKVYNVLAQRFRHGVTETRSYLNNISKHQSCFEAVAVLTQYSIEDYGQYGAPLFDI